MYLIILYLVLLFIALIVGILTALDGEDCYYFNTYLKRILFTYALGYYLFAILTKKRY